MLYITPSLYSAWKYWKYGDFSQYENVELENGDIDYVGERKRDEARKSYIEYLGKVKTEPSEGMLRGREFEDVVYQWISDGTPVLPERTLLGDNDIQFAKEIAYFIGHNCIWQVPGVCEIAGVVLFGIADAINRGIIYDVKRTKSFDVGEYYDSIQHLTYMKQHNLDEFKYFVATPSDLFVDYYKRDDDLLESRVKGFLNDLRNDPQAFELWEANWQWRR
jgi:hypothetical protein